MTQPEVVLCADLASPPLEESQPGIYDRPIGLRLLHRDPGSGAEHYLVRLGRTHASQPALPCGTDRPGGATASS